MTAKRKGSPQARRSPAKRARMKRMRRRRVRSTLLLLCLLGALCAFGGGAIYLLNGGLFFEEPVEMYRSFREFEGSLGISDALKADGFAKDLCVVTEDVPLEGVSLGESQEGVLLDLSGKRVLFAKGAHDRVYPASITKIMTAILALKYGNMSDTVAITEENVTLEEGSQVCGFAPGDKVTMDQLLNCLLVYSGNDAASAIAQYVGGSTQGFVDMMNSCAAQLGCTGTHFTNPHGLHDEAHYTTPYDIYLMLKEALEYPEFTRITQLPSYTVEYTRGDGSVASTVLDATDHYLTGEASAPRDVVILGGKTGTTSDAGNCLALLCQNAYGKPFVSIVMGADTKGDLYQQMNTLLQNINSLA
ncbi:MAG: serine hydrolase [Eubacteriales bacterium]|nr:serine hydrolase [Eubacteriales bacterium]